jgi:hypothetical protein
MDLVEMNLRIWCEMLQCDVQWREIIMLVKLRICTTNRIINYAYGCRFFFFFLLEISSIFPLDDCEFHLS